MAVISKFTTSGDFWRAMVIRDCDDSRINPADLRYALHAANSLFHMHDWVFHTHAISMQAAPPKRAYRFTYKQISGPTITVSTHKEFANALETANNDFGRIRGIANAGKHLRLDDIRPVQNAPSNAANTRIQTTAFGQGGYGAGPYGGSARVMLEGDNGSDWEFSSIRENVFRMWEALISLNLWH